MGPLSPLVPLTWLEGQGSEWLSWAIGGRTLALGGQGWSAAGPRGTLGPLTFSSSSPYIKRVGHPLLSPHIGVVEVPLPLFSISLVEVLI